MNTLLSNGMGENSVTNHGGGEHTNKLNTQTNNQSKQQLFEIETFLLKVFCRKKTCYYFRMGGKTKNSPFVMNAELL